MEAGTYNEICCIEILGQKIPAHNYIHDDVSAAIHSDSDILATIYRKRPILSNFWMIIAQRRLGLKGI